MVSGDMMVLTGPIDGERDARIYALLQRYRVHPPGTVDGLSSVPGNPLASVRHAPRNPPP